MLHSNRSLALLLILSLLLAASVNAHYKLTVPPARGSDEEKQLQGPCGGYNSVQSPRNRLSTKPEIEIKAFHPKAEFSLLISFLPNPSKTSDFVYLLNTTLPDAKPYKIPVDLSAPQTLSALSAKFGDSFKTAESLVGKEATIGTIYESLEARDGVLYQCSDVVITDASGNVPNGAAETTGFVGRLTTLVMLVGTSVWLSFW
ncbi:hypothetical protein BKA69DRAFT_1178361 [Paraphysoderma sedebokerense]|nr:hypothetical protein BKA69DRAFT_1178361 [Paraphysoderma sedebokerense]